MNTAKLDDNMETDVTEKVDIARILIERVDGLPSKARVSSLEAANKVLDEWSDCAPDTGYDQCDFQIVFEDGFRYQGHYLLNKSTKRVSLARHVRKHLMALAKRADAEDAETETDDKPISLIGADIAESAKIVLDQYNI